MPSAWSPGYREGSGGWSSPVTDPIKQRLLHEDQKLADARDKAAAGKKGQPSPSPGTTPGTTPDPGKKAPGADPKGQGEGPGSGGPGAGPGEAEKASLDKVFMVRFADIQGDLSHYKVPVEKGGVLPELDYPLVWKIKR